MAKGRAIPALPETVISIIGPGMVVNGDCESTDTIRIEGKVEGSVVAEKAVVVGKNAYVQGDIHAADAKIAGTVKGTLEIRSRLELGATAVVNGEIRTALMQLDEGGIIHGSVQVGRDETPASDGDGATNPAATG